MAQYGGGGDQADLYFSAELQDNVSPTADQIEKRLKSLGANKHEIKIFLQAYDQASGKIQQAQDRLKKLPRQHTVHLQANTDSIDRAHEQLNKLKEIAKAPITITFKAVNDIKDHFQSFKQQIPRMEMELRNAMRNSPLTAGMLGGTAAAYNVVSGPLTQMTGLPFSAVGVGAGVAGAGAAGAAFFQKSFELNAQLEQQMAQLTQILRTPAAAQSAYNQVTKTSLNTPFNQPDVLNSYIQMAQMGTNPNNRAFGIGAAANLGAGAQVPISRATGALQAGSLGYFEQFNTLTGRNIHQTDFTYGGRYSGQTYEKAVLSVLKQYQDASKTQMETFKGLMTNIQDTITQKLVIPAGAPLFGAAKGLEQSAAGRMQSPMWQMGLSREVDKLQTGLIKVFQLAQKGSTYFQNSLEQPLKQITSATIKLGVAFGQAFGGTIVTGVKYLAEALTTILTPLASIGKQLPIIAQVAGVIKGLNILGIHTNIGAMFGNLFSINPMRWVEGMRQFASLVGKISLYFLVKGFLDAKNANDQLDAAFKQFGNNGKKTLDELKVGFDALIFRAAELGKSVPQLKAYGAIAAEGVGPSVGINKLTQVARFGALDIAKLSLPNNLHLGGKDTAQIFQTWEKAMNATNAINTGTSPRREMDQVAAQIYQAARELSKTLGISLGEAAKDATISLKLFSHQLNQTSMVTPRGASAAYSVYQHLSRVGGMTAQDYTQYGSPEQLTQQLLSNAVAPSVGVLQSAIHQRGGLGASFSFKRGQPNLYGAHTADIMSILSSYGNIPGSSAGANRQIQGLFGGALGAVGGVSLPQFENVLPKLGINTTAGQVKGMNTKQSAQEIINLNTALGKVQNVLQGVNQQITNTQDNLSKLGIVTEQAQAAMAKFNLRVEKQQNAIDQWQINLQKLQVNGLNPLQRAIAAASQKMADYQQNAILPVQRAQEDWNQAMLLTSNRLEDVSFSMQKAQYNMSKFNDGMLTGENALTAQIQALTVYNQKLDMLRLQNMGMQADLSKTQFHQGFTSIVKPLMGFDLAREVQLGQQRQQMMQDQYDTTYGNQHWQLQRAARTRFQAQEMSFAQRLAGTTAAASTISAGTVETMAIQIQQYQEQLKARKLQEHMYALTVAQRPLQDEQYRLNKQAFVLQQNISKQSDKIANATLGIQQAQLPIQHAMNHISNVATIQQAKWDKQLLTLNKLQGDLTNLPADLHQLFGDFSGNFNDNIKAGPDTVLGHLSSIANNMYLSREALQSINAALGGKGGGGGSFPTGGHPGPHGGPGTLTAIKNTAIGLLDPRTWLQTMYDATKFGFGAISGLGGGGVPGTILGAGVAGAGLLEMLNLGRIATVHAQGRIIAPMLQGRAAHLDQMRQMSVLTDAAKAVGMDPALAKELGINPEKALRFDPFGARGKGIDWYGGFLKRQLASAPLLGTEGNLLRRVIESPLIHPTSYAFTQLPATIARWGTAGLTAPFLGPGSIPAGVAAGEMMERHTGAQGFQWFRGTRSFLNFMKDTAWWKRILFPVTYPLHLIHDAVSGIGRQSIDHLKTAATAAQATAEEAKKAGWAARAAEGAQGAAKRGESVVKPMFSALVDSSKVAGGGGWLADFANNTKVKLGQVTQSAADVLSNLRPDTSAAATVAAEERNFTGSLRNAASSFATSSKNMLSSDTARSQEIAKLKTAVSEGVTWAGDFRHSVQQNIQDRLAAKKDQGRTMAEQAKAAQENVSASGTAKKAAQEGVSTAEKSKTAANIEHEASGAFRDIIKGKWASTIEHLSGKVGDFGRFVGHLTGIAAVFEIASTIFNDNTHFLNGITKAFNDGVNFMNGIVRAFKDGVSRFVEGIGQFLKDASRLFHKAPGGSSVFEDIAKGARAVGNKLGDIGGTAIKYGGKALNIAGKVGGALSFVPGVGELIGGQTMKGISSLTSAAEYYAPVLGDFKVLHDLFGLKSSNPITLGNNSSLGNLRGQDLLNPGSILNPTKKALDANARQHADHWKTVVELWTKNSNHVVRLSVDSQQQQKVLQDQWNRLSAQQQNQFFDLTYNQQVTAQKQALQGPQGLQNYLQQINDHLNRHYSIRATALGKAMGNENTITGQGFQGISGTTGGWLGALTKQINKWEKDNGLPITTKNAAQSGVASAVGSVVSTVTNITSGLGNIFTGAAHGGFIHGDKHKVGPGRIIRMVEEGHPEVVVPLAPHRRDRAKSLIHQLHGHLGMAAGGRLEPRSAWSTDYNAGFNNEWRDWFGVGHDEPVYSWESPAYKRGVHDGTIAAHRKMPHWHRTGPALHHIHISGHHRALDTIKKLAAGGYVNPMAKAQGIVPERVDMGVDYGFKVGSVLDAIGPAKVNLAMASGSGWPGGGYVNMTFTGGPMKGRSWYLAENISPLVRQNQMVQAGDPIAKFVGGPYGTEWGWAAGPINQTLAAALHQQSTGGDPGANRSAAGQSFSNFLASLGAPAGIGSGRIVGDINSLPFSKFSAGMAKPIHLKGPPTALDKFGIIGPKQRAILSAAMKKWEDSLNSQAANATASAGGGHITNQSGPAAAKSWTLAAMQLAGVSGSDWLNMLLRQENRESSFNPNSINLWDSNARAGTPSKGILQMIDPTFKQYMLGGHGNIWNPVDNITAAIRYIIGKYGHGNPGAGLQFMINNGGRGYAGGLPRVPYDNFPAILHKDETVLSAAQANIKGNPAGYDKSELTAIKEAINTAAKDIRAFNKAVQDHAGVKTLVKLMTESRDALNNINKVQQQTLLAQIQAEIKATGPKATHLDHLLGTAIAKGGHVGPLGAAGTQTSRLVNNLIDMLHNLPSTHRVANAGKDAIFKIDESSMGKLNTIIAEAGKGDRKDVINNLKQLDATFKAHHETALEQKAHHILVELQKHHITLKEAKKELTSLRGDLGKKIDAESHLVTTYHSLQDDLNKLQKLQMQHAPKSEIKALKHKISSEENQFITQGMKHGIARSALTYAIRHVGAHDNQGILSDTQLRSIPSALRKFGSSHQIGLSTGHAAGAGAKHVGKTVTDHSKTVAGHSKSHLKALDTVAKAVHHSGTSSVKAMTKNHAEASKARAALHKINEAMHSTAKSHLGVHSDHLGVAKQKLDTAHRHLDTAKSHLITSNEHLKSAKYHTGVVSAHYGKAEGAEVTAQKQRETHTKHFDTKVSADHDHQKRIETHFTSMVNHLNSIVGKLGNLKPQNNIQIDVQVQGTTATHSIRTPRNR